MKVIYNYFQFMINLIQIKFWKYSFRKDIMISRINSSLKKFLYYLLYLSLFLLVQACIGFISFYNCKIFESWKLIPLSNQILWSPIIGTFIIIGILSSALSSIFFSFHLFLFIHNYTNTRKENQNPSIS